VSRRKKAKDETRSIARGEEKGEKGQEACLGKISPASQSTSRLGGEGENDDMAKTSQQGKRYSRIQNYGECGEELVSKKVKT